MPRSPPGIHVRLRAHRPTNRCYSTGWPHLRRRTLFEVYPSVHRLRSRILLAHQYPRDSEDTLLRAFRVLDTEGAGFIEAEKMRSLLALKGDKFTQVCHR